MTIGPIGGYTYFGRWGPEAMIDEFGNAQVGLTVLVKDSEGADAELFTDPDGTDILDNPVTTNSRGHLMFCATPGEYSLHFNSGPDIAITVPMDPREITPGTSSNMLIYTPTWSSFGTGTQPAKGNGTITGKYFLHGYLVYVQIVLGLGSSSTIGTADGYQFTLPRVAEDPSNIYPPGIFYGQLAGPSDSDSKPLSGFVVGDKVTNIRHNGGFLGPNDVAASSAYAIYLGGWYMRETYE